MPAVPCPTPTPPSDTAQVLCSDSSATSNVIGGYFLAQGTARIQNEVAQTFKVNRAGRPGRLRVTLTRLFNPASPTRANGTKPSLVIEIRSLIGGAVDITPGTTTTFASASIPWDVMPLNTPVTQTVALTSSMNMAAGTTYAMVFRIDSADEFAVGIAAHDDPTMYGAATDSPLLTGLIRQTRLSGTNTLSTMPFSTDKRDVNFAFTLDDGCTAGATTTCGIGKCATTVAQCTSGVFNICTPLPGSAETCNNQDDDCDGVVDNNIPAVTCGVGACARTVTGCSGGVVPTCTPGSPTTEICDGADNDCDGATDEALGTVTCGTGVCEKTVDKCKNGAPQTCTADTTKSTEESCNGLDDNCDGLIDNKDATGAKLSRTYYAGPDSTLDAVTKLPIPVCSTGVQTCAAVIGSGSPIWTVTTPDVEPTTEACDGKDNDCEGTVDGVAGVKMVQACWPAPPYTAAQRNVGICRDGTAACNAALNSGTASWGSCTNAITPISELCNGKDDDCNGIVDDMGILPACGYGRCTVQTSQCVAGVAQNCTPDTSQVRTEVCNGVDDDCNGTIDKDGTGNTLTQSCYDTATYPYTSAQTAAASANVGRCKTGTQTCNAASVTISPNAPPSYPGTTSWTSCSGAIYPGTESCNNVDDNCDGLVDNPSTSLCAATANVTGTNCSAGACSVTSCAPYTYNANGVYSDGCECVDDTPTRGTTCGAPYTLGTLTVNTALTYAGKVPTTSLIDYIKVNITPTADLNTAKQGKIVFSFSGTSSADYKMQVFDAAACGQYKSDCAAQVDYFTYQDSCNTGSSTNNCNSRSITATTPDFPTAVVVKVIRTATSGGVCAGYTLTASYCTGATCGAGCTIGGVFYTAGTINGQCLICDPTLSTTAWSNRASTTTCDDGTACTKNDVCSAGVCAGTAYTCTANQCQSASACDGLGTCIPTSKASGIACTDDGNACTADYCDGSGTCSHPLVSDGTSCGTGQCLAGVCTAYSYSWQTSNWSACTLSGCSGSQSRTVWCQRSDGSTVASSYCTGSQPAASQTCNAVAGAACTDDANACTSDYCNGTGSCSHPALPDLTSCNSGFGRCVSGACSNWTFSWDGTAWTTCSIPALSCSGTQTRTTTCKRSDGTVVADSFCSAGSKPQTSNVCYAGSGFTCADESPTNPCTSDYCDGSGSCLHANVPDSTPCSGGLCFKDPLTTVARCCPGGVCN